VRFLADENFPGPLVRALRDKGHDVAAVKEMLRGAADGEVLEWARREARLLVTFDKDFGELAFRLGLPATCGIILFRLMGSSPEVDNARVLAALESPIEWKGSFSVVTNDRIRIRPLPS
jgi:predicted nuclease of predicted toxin-antitoxin system